MFCEVKAKSGPRHGHPLEMVDGAKRRRVRAAAGAWLARRPELAALDCRFEVVAVRGRRLERVADDLRD